MPSDKASAKLDKYVALRGDVAHRGKAAKSVHKSDVEGFIEHVKFLVRKTGGRVHSTVTKATGKKLW